MSDMVAALRELTFDIDRMIGLVEGLKLSPQVKDQDALEMAMFDLINSKAMIIMALVGEEVSH